MKKTIENIAKQVQRALNIDAMETAVQIFELSMFVEFNTDGKKQYHYNTAIMMSYTIMQDVLGKEECDRFFHYKSI